MDNDQLILFLAKLNLLDLANLELFKIFLLLHLHSFVKMIDFTLRFRKHLIKMLNLILEICLCLFCLVRENAPLASNLKQISLSRFFSLSPSVGVIKCFL